MQSFFQTLVSGLSFGAVYALVALGFSLVYRTMGLVNFAHGAVLMIGAYVASTFYLSARLPFAAFRETVLSRTKNTSSPRSNTSPRMASPNPA